MLAIDEPTNHLDSAARSQLAEALRGFRGIGILVSHDRDLLDLLDALAQRCASFEAGGIVVRPGGYTVAHNQAERERSSALSERKAAKAEFALLSAEKERRAHEAARADARNTKRGIDPKDHDAKGKIDLARFSGQDGARGKLSAQMGGRMRAAKARVDAAFVHKRYDGDLWFDAQPHPRKALVRVEPATIPCGDRALEAPALYVGNTDHVGVVGPNGAGKSMLLGHVRTLVPEDVRVLDIPQEVSPSVRDRTLEAIAALSPAERGRVLSTIAQLNSDPDRVLAGSTTSPGELRKLMLALGLLHEPQLVLMDEPTNHLDLHSVEALERALAAYPGALVLVSHDRPFLAACTNRTWEVDEGIVRERF